ncbi:hypothetical protein V8C40DRAFT_238434 [Trichoderma camerunense]
MLPVCAGTLATTSRLACLFGLVITKNEGMSLTEIRRRWHRRQRRFVGQRRHPNLRHGDITDIAWQSARAWSKRRRDLSNPLPLRP